MAGTSVDKSFDDFSSTAGTHIYNSFRGAPATRDRVDKSFRPSPQSRLSDCFDSAVALNIYNYFDFSFRHRHAVACLSEPAEGNSQSLGPRLRATGHGFDEFCDSFDR